MCMEFIRLSFLHQGAVYLQDPLTFCTEKALDMVWSKILSRLSPVWRGIHWLIIINLLVQCLYGGYMVFFVITTGHIGPLAEVAKEIPHELMMTRRAYALETWVAIAGLSIYLGVTEILPRKWSGGNPAGSPQ